MAYVPHTDTQIAEMLQAIGVEKFDDLVKSIPQDIQLTDGLDMPGGLSELETRRALDELAGKNRSATESIGFLGGGSYDHFIPAGVGALTSRSEWYTAYTPYQPEVSQGTLQAIYEYQSVICDLTGMDVANASIYDGATALNEAMLLALRAQRKRTRILVSQGVHPHYLQVLRTYATTSDIDIEFLPVIKGRTEPMMLREAMRDDVAIFLFAQPNFFGVLEEAEQLSEIAHNAGALVGVSTYPVSLGMLKAPRDYGADIVTGEGQCLGNAMGFGGPYLGVFAATKKLMRQMPGRIAGQTADVDGKRGFVLTLQTREQHIRRGKATSNICTNEGLNALSALIHLALLGKEGFKQVAELSYHKAHYLHDQIGRLDGYSFTFDYPFFNEFVVKTPVPAADVVTALEKKGIFPGIRLDRFYSDMDHDLLVAVTEKRTRQDMDRLVEELAAIR